MADQINNPVNVTGPQQPGPGIIPSASSQQDATAASTNAPDVQDPNAAPANVATVPGAPNPSQATPPPPQGNIAGQPIPKQTFREGAQSATPSYHVDENGNIVSNAPVRQTSAKGVFGNILVNVLKGMAAGMASPTPEGATGKGAAVSAGAQGAAKQREFDNAHAMQDAQIQFETQQKATHDKLQNNLIAYQTMAEAKRLSMQEDEHKVAMTNYGLEADEHHARNQILNDQTEEENDMLIANINANGVHPTAKTGVSIKDNQQHVVPTVSGASMPLLSGRGDNLQMNHFSTAQLNTPLTITEYWPSYNGAISDGNAQDNLGNTIPKGGYVPQWNAVTPDGKTTVRDYALQFKAGQKQKLDLQDKANTDAKNALDLDVKKSETAKNYAESNKANKEASNADQNNPVTLSMGQQLVDTNMDPSQLSKKASNYYAVLAAADQYSMAKYGKHFDIAQAQTDYKYANNVATQNTLKYLDSVIPNMANLVKQSDAIGRTQFPPLNDAEMWAKMKTGDPQIAAYEATVTEVADQIAKILQGGGTGSGSSDAKLKQAQDLFSKGFTGEQIKAVVGAISPLLDSRKSAIIGNNRYLQKQFGVGQPQIPSGATIAQGPSGHQIYSVNGGPWVDATTGQPLAAGGTH